MAAIVLYYSRAGENYFSGAIRPLAKGNTETVAEEIARLTSAELFRVEQAAPYSDSYSECIEQAKRHQRRGARPELARWPGGLDRFDTVYLGYPNYWGTMPMAMFARTTPMNITFCQEPTASTQAARKKNSMLK